MSVGAGKNTLVKIAGTKAAFTTEACTQIGATDNYYITDRTKILWDRDETFIVYDGGSPVSSSAYTLDYLSGTIYLDATPSGAVTVTGYYRPSSDVSWAREFSLSMSTGLEDSTTFASAVTDSDYRSKTPTLKEASGTIGGFFDADDTLVTSLQADTTIVILFRPDSNTAYYFYIEAYIESDDVNTDVEALVNDSLNFSSTFKVETSTV